MNALGPTREIARSAPLRGACPGLATPMPTGDGLLARLTPSGATMGLDAVATLAAAARRHGNGIIEVTARGNIQVRGLSTASADAFAHALAALDIGAPEGVPVLTDPLAGLEPEQTLDTLALAAALRERLAATTRAAIASPKLSVVIDGGRALHLDAVPADIRLRIADADGEERFHVALGGDAQRATPLGTVAATDTIEAVVCLVATIARRGPTARAHELIRSGQLDALRSAVAGLAADGPAAPARARAEVIGMHALRDGRTALGIGLAFGHVEAATFDRLLDAAARAGANGLRTAPGRAVLLIGRGALTTAVPQTTTPTPTLSPQGGRDLTAACEHLGFITRPDDPRRRVVACAGAPICASAHIAARALAPMIAERGAHLIDGLIHLSGCPKGCAHPGAAALTIAGNERGCGVVVNGTARDLPVDTIAAHDLPDAIARLAGRRGGPPHG